VSEYQTTSASTACAAGEYRRWSGVTLAGNVLVSRRPLAATRLNDAAIALVATLDEDDFHSPETVARETNSDPEAVAALFERLHRRRFLEWRPARDPTHRPPVSVVVTVRNDREHLRKCLDALADLSYPTYEVVVVDDGSTDGTTDLVSDHRLADDGRVRYVPVGSADDPCGIGASRNRGVEAAAYDVVAFTDADCRPRSDWLSDLVPCLATHDLVGGRVRPAGDSAASAYEAVNSSLDMGAHAARVDPGGATPYLPTANLVGTREVFETAGFPDRNVAEDVEVCWNALDAGFDVVYTPTGVVEHSYRSGLPFVRRRATYGASEALLARSHGRTETDSVGVSAVGSVSGVLAFLGRSGVGTLSIAALGIVALLLCLWAGIHGRRLRRRWRQLGTVTWGDVVRSWLRERLSSAYALSREVVRYYTAPLVLVGFAAWLAGAGLLAGVVLAGLVVTTVLALVVEYRVHDPETGFPGYAAYYLADHFGYQYGVYRGALAHRTLVHLRPDSRFEFVGLWT
jgi:mycofactocin system glycosyltransferase